MNFGAAILFVAMVVHLGDCGSHSDWRKNICKEEGPRALHGMCDIYCECRKTGEDGVLMADIKVCSDDTEFDPVKLECVPAGEVPDCRRRVARQAAVLNGCDGKTVSCDGCHSMSVCANTRLGLQPMASLSCYNEERLMYCNPEKPGCSNIVPFGCNSGFQCTGSGYFPDPEDCTRYHFCHERFPGSLVDMTLYCDPGQVFSTAVTECVDKATAEDCHTTSCPVNATTVVSFPREPSYFAVCVFGKPVFVGACPDGTQYSNETHQCEVFCNKAGKIPDHKNCTLYYECKLIRGQWVATHSTCMPMYYFDKVASRCVPGMCWQQPEYPPVPWLPPNNTSNLPLQ